MVNQLQVYSNEEFGVIRCTVIDGETWLVGKDVAQALGYERRTKAVVDHVDEEDRKMVDGETQSQIGTELGQRGGWLINESGMYSLILSSKLERAKKFKRWVTSEVLPAIRKQGYYSLIQNKPSPLEQFKEVTELGKSLMAEIGITKEEAFLTSIELVEKYYDSNLDALKKIIISEKIVPSENREVANLNATQVGELIGISAQLVNEILVRCGLQVRYGKEYRLTDKGKPYGREIPFYRNGHNGYRVLWKPKVTDALTDGKFFIRRQTANEHYDRSRSRRS